MVLEDKRALVYCVISKDLQVVNGENGDYYDCHVDNEDNDE